LALYLTGVTEELSTPYDRRLLMTLSARLRLQHLTVTTAEPEAEGNDNYDNFTDYRHQPTSSIELTL